MVLKETIAAAEYVRALKLNNNNNKNDACILFRELLETEVLHNVSNEKKDKLFLVKYNCYKNLGFIYNDLGDSEMALNYLLNVRILFSVDFITHFIDCTNIFRHTSSMTLMFLL